MCYAHSLNANGLSIAVALDDPVAHDNPYKQEWVWYVCKVIIVYLWNRSLLKGISFLIDLTQNTQLEL